METAPTSSSTWPNCCDPYQLDADDNLIEDAEKDARLERLHYETLAALQIFLMHAELITPA